MVAGLARSNDFPLSSTTSDFSEYAHFSTVVDNGLLGRDHEQVSPAVREPRRIEAQPRGVCQQLGVVEERQLVGDRGEVGAAFLPAHLGLALNRDVREAARERLPLPEGLREPLANFRRGCFRYCERSLGEASVSLAYHLEGGRDNSWASLD